MKILVDVTQKKSAENVPVYVPDEIVDQGLEAIKEYLVASNKLDNVLEFAHSVSLIHIVKYSN